MSDKPTTPFGDGRGPRGRFAKGNAGGPGNPHAKRVARLRAALFASVKPADLRQVIEKLLEQAKAGEVQAIRELLQRLLGPPEAVDFVERLEALEQRIAGMQKDRP